MTPLMVACYYKHNDCVRVLLEHDADLHVAMTFCSGLPMPAGSSALHCAARGNNMRAAVMLLQELVRIDLCLAALAIAQFAGSPRPQCAARSVCPLRVTAACSITVQVNRMARLSPAGVGDARTRASWEGDRALDLRVVSNSIAATPLSYALYVVRDDVLCILLDPTRPVAGAIAALDPAWAPTRLGAPSRCC